MADLIQPRTLSGFRDYPPELMIPRERLLEQARRVYRSYGFAPIDTPALEYAEILLGKTDPGAEVHKIIYRFRDNGDRDVGLRFDLTVPFARFAAQYVAQLGTPFKRYHMGPVWRGERPGAGRFREFWQCDFDTIGTTSNAADVEVVLVIHDLMKALGVERFRIHVNSRCLLNGLLDEVGLSGQTARVLRSLDKLQKIGPDKVVEEMTASEEGQPPVTREQAQRVLSLVQIQGDNREVLDQVERMYGGNERTAEGVKSLRELIDVARTSGIAEECVKLDLSIARGLDYYTGTIYETFLTDLPEYGSVCSGGRYDNLAGLYTKQPLPGVGASLGLDRLLAALEELKLLPKGSTPAPVLVVQFDAARLGDYQRIARVLRGAGIGAEVYPETKKIGQQLGYAEKRGFRVALIAGGNEFSKGVWKVKNLAARTETAVPESDVITVVRRILTPV